MCIIKKSKKIGSELGKVRQYFFYHAYMYTLWFWNIKTIVVDMQIVLVYSMQDHWDGLKIQLLNSKGELYTTIWF